METHNTKEEKKVEQAVPAVDEYAGVAIDTADDNKVDQQLEKERTSTLNNNPSNDYL